MKLNLTDGKSLISFILSEDLDARAVEQVRKSKNKVKAAMRVIERRYGNYETDENGKGLYIGPPEWMSGLYPVDIIDNASGEVAA